MIGLPQLLWCLLALFYLVAHIVGTFKFLGFVYITKEGYADLTEAGYRIVSTKRTDIVMLKQLIKWQYPDNQHSGKAYSEETYPVIRHVEDFRQKVNDEETYGLFIAPRCHDDTIHQFFVSWKHGVRSGKITKIVPLTISQFRDVLRPYVAKREFQPIELCLLFEKFGETLLNSQNSMEWHGKFPAIIEEWERQRREEAGLQEQTISPRDAQRVVIKQARKTF